MKIYAAIGHYKDTEILGGNICSVAFRQRTKKDFMIDCYCNGFVPYVVFTESLIEKIFDKSSDDFEVYDQVKKMTTNYRVWNKVTDFIMNAGYLITDQIAALKENK